MLSFALGTVAWSLLPPATGVLEVSIRAQHDRTGVATMRKPTWSLRAALRRWVSGLAPGEGWTQSIALSGASTPFDVLQPVSHYTGMQGHINPETLKLEMPLRAYVENDTYPLPVTADREGYHADRHYDYWLSGLRDYLALKAALVRRGRGLDPGTALFDLGCASGRVLRHFLCQEPGLELWGADINRRHVNWMLRFLGPSLKVFQNSVLPVLPLEDNSMSLVCAFSVFTHIDAFELAWLAEVRRVLKPGGIAYVTVHSEHTWSILGPQHALYNDLIRMRKAFGTYKVTPELFKKSMPSDRLVFRWPFRGSAYHCTVFHSSDHIRSVWSRLFRILEVRREAVDYQDVVILEKD